MSCFYVQNAHVLQITLNQVFVKQMVFAFAYQDQPALAVESVSETISKLVKDVLVN